MALKDSGNAEEIDYFLFILFSFIYVKIKHPEGTVKAGDAWR